MKIYVPADMAEALERQMVTGKRAYSRKAASTTLDFERMRLAELKRRRRLLARAR